MWQIEKKTMAEPVHDDAGDDAIVCFASVAMHGAWYGVNFVLGARLHSDGVGGPEDDGKEAGGSLPNTG